MPGQGYLFGLARCGAESRQATQTVCQVEAEKVLWALQEVRCCHAERYSRRNKGDPNIQKESCTKLKCLADFAVHIKTLIEIAKLHMDL